KNFKGGILMTRKRNSFYDDVTYSKVPRENKDILDDYILEMKSNGRSEKTIYQYSADIKMFFCYAYHNIDENKSILEFKQRDFRRFFLRSRDSGASTSRINRIQCSLRNMLEFCSQDEDEYDYPVNMMRSIKGLEKETVREIHFLEDSQINAIVDHLVKNKKYQQALYLMLSYESAGRRNEVFQVLKDGLLENNRTNEVIGKGNKRFRLLYFNRTQELAQLYLEQRGEDDIPEMWT